MEEKIRAILINKLREYFKNFHIDAYDSDIINIINFHPFEMQWDNLNNISGNNVSFTCWIKGKRKGIVKQNETYSFNFSQISAVIVDNVLVDLDIENMNIMFM